MPALKIGIVEDEIIIAESIAIALQDLGYEVPEPACNYIDAISLLIRHRPDLIILDIRLNDAKDGIDLAKRINDEFGIPFVFLTANADRATIDRAKLTEPAAYLIKPFTKNDLYASIEVAAMRYGFHGHKANKEKTTFIKDGSTLRKIALNDIVHLDADHVYVNVHTLHRKFLIRSSMQGMLDQLNDDRFYQTHRSHAINLHYIDEVRPNAVTVRDKEIPLSKSHRDKLMELLTKNDLP